MFKITVATNRLTPEVRDLIPYLFDSAEEDKDCTIVTTQDESLLVTFLDLVQAIALVTVVR